MVKQIVFDIGNVMTDFCWREVIASCGFSKDAETVLAKEVFLSPLWKEFDRGVMGDEAIKTQMRKNAAGYETEFDCLFARFRELVQEREYAKALVLELKKKGLGVFVLSNYGKTMYESNAVHFAFLKEVDDAVFSYREKLLKPDADLYRLMLERFQIKACETLFLDDLKENVEGAEAVGINACVVNSKETILEALKKYGIMIETI